MIVRANCAADRRGAVEIGQQLQHVRLAENLQGFAEMCVVQISLHASPDFPGLILAAADGKQFLQIVDERVECIEFWQKTEQLIQRRSIDRRLGGWTSWLPSDGGGGRACRLELSALSISGLELACVGWVGLCLP